MRVFVTGGTGLVGTRLVRHLAARGNQVVVLTRRPEAATQKFAGTCAVVEGDPMQAGPWMDTVADCDAVIHLAGENVFARRWNEKFKTLLRDSRVLGSQNIAQALIRQAQTGGRARVLVNASAIGYYGIHGDEELSEDSPPGSDFLARLCVDWEQAAHAVEQAGIRCALVRVGVVLDKEGGALAKLLTPFKMFGGGPVGSGRQWMSWIHHADLVGLFLFALDHQEAAGPLNGTAPNPVTNRDFSTVLGRVLHRPSFVKTPAFALRMLIGEAADVVVTGQRVLPRKAEKLGYSFQFPTVEGALLDILR